VDDDRVRSRFVIACGSMPKKSPKRDLRDSEFTAATAEVVFGWKNVHDHEGQLVGKKPDKLGRRRLAKVPDYATDPTQAHAIDGRMKKLGRGELYAKELARLTKAERLPAGWARPEQRSRASLRTAPEQRSRAALKIVATKRKK
jgi:hypothetical protein